MVRCVAGEESTIRIVTWNCCRRELHLERSAAERLCPDILVLQEAARPDSLGPGHAWSGSNPRMGIYVAGYGGIDVEPTTVESRSALAVVLATPEPISLVAIWTQPEPTYSAAVLRELERHRSLLAGPSIVAGDFNTNAALDRTASGTSHAAVVRMLEDSFGLVSAYHAFTGDSHGAEQTPTHYWRWREESRFHLDYCFVPRTWRITKVEIGNFADWRALSDHRPLIVDVDPQPTVASYD